LTRFDFHCVHGVVLSWLIVVIRIVTPNEPS
jgi:hypothetical protein